MVPPFCGVGAPLDAVTPCGPFVHIPLIPPFWAEGHGSGRCPQPMGPLAKFALKSGDLLCSGGGGGVGCGRGGSGCSGGGGGDFTKFVLDGGGSGIGCDISGSGCGGGGGGGGGCVIGGGGGGSGGRFAWDVGAL